jgi:hypothetical protein
VRRKRCQSRLACASPLPPKPTKVGSWPDIFKVAGGAFDKMWAIDKCCAMFRVP